MADKGSESRTLDLSQLTLWTSDDGLDKLLKGGFKLPKSGDGLVLLIKGKPGTGKSTLALQIANSISNQLRNGKKSKDDWFFFTCEQKKEDICEKALFFSYNIDEKHILDKRDMDNLGTTADSLQALTQSTLMWVTNTVNKFLLGNAKDEKKQKNVVVIDGLDLMNFDERIRFNMDWLVSVLRKYSRFSILVYEPMEGEKSQIDSMVDMIIQLKGEEVIGPPPYYLNKLSILKSRFQACILGWHQYKIIAGRGLVVFPSIQ
jgi:KaiC/GvpD/RAD55 family RecA-like ATPase